ncbi:SRPBCC family protein [Pseudohoeflea coraliihabitans]|uniref:Carbon monoxide dehydrogenase subunit G n=1 Tax=Pseudohoeflea coraliihabitans TaxID=2860393 RepID=A0ABS6WN82_9HYPH|nr:carbon monoxide dehydrogenase subunit G [Pseudohoeflea sp. DP4N28-3]MBW3097250.1 carbon monoxide dehydrogenase subunit G [Pseudohoeflea sp. DP4N28-3]
MDLKGTEQIAASKDAVWAALNDPNVLKDCIPGCQSLEKIDEQSMKATVKLKIGVVSARFNGAVSLKNIDPPNAYRIEGEGKGGVAGFASGGADVVLTAIDASTTELHYDCQARVGGKIAQMGSRLIDSTARKLAAQFFTRFNEIVSETADR